MRLHFLSALAGRDLGPSQSTRPLGLCNKTLIATKTGLIMAAVVIASTCLPTAASAADAASIPSDHIPELSLTLFGRVNDRCTLSGGGVLALGELTANKTVAADFSLDCNVPFEMSIATANGGLTHETKPKGEGTFVGHLDYDVSVRLPVMNPTISILSASYSSANILGSLLISSGNAIAAPGNGRFSLTTRSLSASGLLAGSYSDVITISVATRF